LFRDLGRVVLLVDDHQKALAFYRDVLGFETLHDEDVAGLRYLHVGLPGQPTVGIWLMPPMTDEERGLVGRQAGNQPLLVLYTDDLDEVRQQLAAHDVDVWAERADDSSRSLHFRDVAGNVVVAAELTSGPIGDVEGSRAAPTSP
jgi:predicted enzyme related to lactoylglutathione lyase